MSRPAKKDSQHRKSRDTQLAKPQHIQSVSQQKSGLRSGAFVSIGETHAQDLLAKLTDLLSASLSHAHICVARTHPALEGAQIEWGCGQLEPLVNTQIDSSHPVLKSALSREDRAPLILKDLAQLDFPFAPARAGGMATLSRLDLGSSSSILVIMFQPQEHGPFPQSQLQVFNSLVSLVQTAAQNLIPSQETTAHEIRLANMRAEIGELRRFYRRFSNAIHQCFWILDLEAQRVITVSDNFEEIWGAPRKILAQGGLSGFMTTVVSEDRDRVLAEFHNNLGSELSIELRVLDESGDTRWIWLRGFPSFDESDGTSREFEPQARQILFIADDITRKKREEERQRTEEVQLVSNARHMAVVDLASGVAHEINNPLTVIVGKASELKRLMASVADEQVEKANDIINKIQSTAVRISEIVLSLKAVARKEQVGNLVPAPFEPIVNELRDLASARFAAYNVRLEVISPEPSLVAEMNATLVSQVILNLVNNAFDAVQDEKDKWVQVDFTQDSDSVYVAVTDSGPGIPIKNRGRIFDPFFTTKEPGKGTGLGLAIAASIASHHNGSLRLDNLNPNTRFVLQIPKKHKLQPTRKGR